MAFRFRGLSAEPFAPLLALGDAELEARGMRRMIADGKPGFPCRVSLEDAEPGERLILVPFEHQPAYSPYRAAGPIYIRGGGQAAFDRIDALPSVFAGRLLSVRAYDAQGMMCDADVVDSDPRALFDAYFADPATDYLHVHYARRGCYSCRVDRV